MELPLVVFIGIVAVALLLQSLAFWGIHRSLRRISVRVDGLSADLMKTVDSLSSKVDDVLSTVKNTADRMRGLQDNLIATGAIVQKRIIELDAFLDETTAAARIQIARLQEVVENTSSRIEATFDTVHRGILVPVSELSAVAKGIKVALDVLLGKNKKPVRRSHPDEEMFI